MAVRKEYPIEAAQVIWVAEANIDTIGGYTNSTHVFKESEYIDWDLIHRMEADGYTVTRYVKSL